MKYVSWDFNPLFSLLHSLLNIHISFLRSLFQRWLVTFNKVYESPAGKLNIFIEKSNEKSRRNHININPIFRSSQDNCQDGSMMDVETRRQYCNHTIKCVCRKTRKFIGNSTLETRLSLDVFINNTSLVKHRSPVTTHPFSSENEPDELCKLRRNHKEIKSNFIIFKTSDRMHRRDRKKSKRSKYLIKVSLGPICVLSMREREGQRWSVISISQVKLNNFVNDSTPFMCLFRISRKRAVWYNGKKKGWASLSSEQDWFFLRNHKK